jgi:hypothetical protein
MTTSPAGPPLHHFLHHLSPLSAERASVLADFLVAHVPPRAHGAPPPTVVDIGCGWASLLVEILARAPQLRGVGLDLNAGGFDQGRTRAAEAEVLEALTLVEADARTHALTQPGAGVSAAVCIGASQVWGPSYAPDQAPDQPLDYRAALAALRAMLPHGAPLVYGEAIWSRPPTPAAAAPLAGRLDEFIALPELLDLAVGAGFAVVQVHEASQDEWDTFESGFNARHAAWLAAQAPDHPERAAVMQRAQRQRDAYFRGYRGVLGMAYLGLLAV